MPKLLEGGATRIVGWNRRKRSRIKKNPVPSRFIYNRILSFIIRFYSLCLLTSLFFITIFCAELLSAEQKKEGRKIVKEQFGAWEAHRIDSNTLMLNNSVPKVQHMRLYYFFLFLSFLICSVHIAVLRTLLIVRESYQEFHFFCMLYICLI